MANNNLTLTHGATLTADPSSFFKSEERKTNVHEAAHAVVARLLGFRVEWVSIDPDFIKNDPSSIELQTNESSAVCLTRSMDRIGPILAKRKVLTKDEKETVMGYCMHVLAGPYAEAKFDPSTFSPYPSENDYNQAGQMLALTVPNMAARKMLYTLIRRRLDKLLDQEWHKIAEVANALYLKKTLSGDQVDAIIGAEEQREAA